MVTNNEWLSMISKHLGEYQERDATWVNIKFSELQYYNRKQHMGEGEVK